MGKATTNPYETVNLGPREMIGVERAEELARAAARMSSCDAEDSANAALIELIIGIGRIEDAGDRHAAAHMAAEAVYAQTHHFTRGFVKFVGETWDTKTRGVV